MLVSRSARRARRLARASVVDHSASPSRPKAHIKSSGVLHVSQSRSYAVDGKPIDWLNVGQIPDEQLPDLPSEEDYKKQQQSLQDLARRGGQNGDFDFNSITLPPGEAALEKLQATPLKATAPPIKALEQLELKRLMDIFMVHVQLSKHELIVKTFVEMRKDGFLPPQETYNHVLPVLVTWNAHEAISFLEKELAEIGYKRTQPIVTALLHSAIIRGARPEVEARFAELEAAKFDIHGIIYQHVLFYYARMTTDFDATMAWFKKMRNAGKIEDSAPGNIMLDMARVHKFYDVADEIYAEMEKNGDLSFNENRDVIKSTFEGEEVLVAPKQKNSAATYELMAEIYCDQGKEEEMLKFIEKAKNEMETYRGTVKFPKHVVNPRLYEKIVWMHLRKGDLPKTRRLLDEMISDKVRPSEKLFREILVTYMTRDDPRHYQEFLYEFQDIWGYQFDEELYRDVLKMWFRVQDDRRFINTFNQMMNEGIKATPDVRELLILVYARSGRFDDVQRFYDQQLVAGNEITPTMHLVMIDDFLKRGYPGSAREVAQRMAREGSPAPQEALTNIALSYASRGGGFQIINMIEQDMLGKGAKYTITAPILSAALEGLSKVPGEKGPQARETARDAWERYSPQVVLDLVSSTRIIRAFSVIKTEDSALEVYKRTLSEVALNDPSAASDFFLSFLETPASRHTPLQRYTMVKEDMKKAKVPLTIPHYLAILRLCASRAAVKDATTIMKELTLEFYGLPLHRGLVSDYFAVLARYDGGKYRREAMVWINRIVPRAKVHSIFVPSVRGPDVTLDEIRHELLSAVQSMAIAKYIANMDPSSLVESNPDAFDDLFTGSTVDVEDLLVHKYGFDEKVVRDALDSDPEFRKFAADVQTHMGDATIAADVKTARLEEK